MIFQNLPRNVVVALAAIFALLLLASVIVAILKMVYRKKDFKELTLRVRSWWIIVILVSIAFLLSRTAALIFFAFVSYLALKEFLSMIPTRRADRRILFWVYLAIPVQFWWIHIEWYGMFIIFIPVYMFLFLPMRMVVVGETKGFLKAAGTLHWGLMVTVFSLSHMAYHLVLPGEKNPAGGGEGLVLFLLFLTQFNDVAQYVWGKTLGRRRVVPTVSPGKSVAGLLGGVSTTVLLAWVIAPYLTPLNGRDSLIAGVIIGLGGFLGDITISALKRDLGVKESGDLIPGHGGILDRIDSLTFTAPLFLHFIRFLYF